MATPDRHLHGTATAGAACAISAGTATSRPLTPCPSPRCAPIDETGHHRHCRERSRPGQGQERRGGHHRAGPQPRRVGPDGPFARPTISRGSCSRGQGPPRGHPDRRSTPSAEPRVSRCPCIDLHGTLGAVARSLTPTASPIERLYRPSRDGSWPPDPVWVTSTWPSRRFRPRSRRRWPVAADGQANPRAWLSRPAAQASPAAASGPFDRPRELASRIATRPPTLRQYDHSGDTAAADFTAAIPPVARRPVAMTLAMSAGSHR